MKATMKLAILALLVSLTSAGEIAAAEEKILAFYDAQNDCGTDGTACSGNGMCQSAGLVDHSGCDGNTNKAACDADADDSVASDGSGAQCAWQAAMASPHKANAAALITADFTWESTGLNNVQQASTIKTGIDEWWTFTVGMGKYGIPDGAFQTLRCGEGSWDAVTHTYSGITDGYKADGSALGGLGGAPWCTRAQFDKCPSDATAKILSFWTTSYISGVCNFEETGGKPNPDSYAHKPLTVTGGECPVTDDTAYAGDGSGKAVCQAETGTCTVVADETETTKTEADCCGADGSDCPDTNTWAVGGSQDGGESSSEEATSAAGRAFTAGIFVVLGILL